MLSGSLSVLEQAREQLELLEREPSRPEVERRSLTRQIAEGVAVMADLFESIWGRDVSRRAEAGCEAREFRASLGLLISAAESVRRGFGDDHDSPGGRFGSSSSDGTLGLLRDSLDRISQVQEQARRLAAWLDRGQGLHQFPAGLEERVKAAPRGRILSEAEFEAGLFDA
jgi:hypothetical protein